MTIGSASAVTNTFAGTITGTGGSLIKDGINSLRLSGTNTYTGGTTITNGAIIANNNRALGNGPLTLTGTGRLILESILTIDSLAWNTSGSIISILNPGAAYLNVTNSVSFAGAGSTNYFDLSVTNLTATKTQLMSFGTNDISAFSVSQFGLRDGTNIIGGNNYAFSIATNTNGFSALYVALSTLLVNGYVEIPTTNTYPSVTFGTNSTLNITPTGNLTIQTNVTVSNNSTLNLNGIMTVSYGLFPAVLPQAALAPPLQPIAKAIETDGDDRD
jgi:autotransporter-associated beta strand protein